MKELEKEILDRIVKNKYNLIIVVKGEQGQGMSYLGLHILKEVLKNENHV
jgi:pantothenate kinase-related protein Tda10